MSESPPELTSHQMSTERTWMAHERTLMAWVRTSASMTSLGFTIFKFFQYEEGKNSSIGGGFLTPRDFAMIIISIGLLTLILATIAHRRDTRYLVAYLPHPQRSLAVLAAGMMTVFGLLVLVATYLRS